MFKELHELLDGYSIVVAIKKTDDKLTVCVYPDSKDPKASKVKPLMMTGTPEQLDAGFIEAIKTPLQRINKLITNVDEVIESIDEAEKEPKSKVAKTATKAKAEIKPKEPEKPKENFAQMGDEHIKNKDWKSAVYAYEQALKDKPTDKSLLAKLNHAQMWLKATVDAGLAGNEEQAVIPKQEVKPEPLPDIAPAPQVVVTPPAPINTPPPLPPVEVTPPVEDEDDDVLPLKIF